MTLWRANPQTNAVARRKPVQHESQEQRALVQWSLVSLKKYPDLTMLFAVPNGGRRDARTAAFLKLEGVQAGVPDLVLACPKGEYHGLFIELKAGKGRPSALQKAWIEKLNARGYRAVVCTGWEEARDTIVEYLTQ